MKTPCAFKFGQRVLIKQTLHRYTLRNGLEVKRVWERTGLSEPEVGIFLKRRTLANGKIEEDAKSDNLASYLNASEYLHAAYVCIEKGARGPEYALLSDIEVINEA